MSTRLTGRLATECHICRGMGYTTNCAPEMETREDVVLVWRREGTAYRLVPRREVHEVRTIKLGSGCLNCRGTGQVHVTKRQSRLGEASPHN